MTSDVQVSERAGVSYDTLMNWFAGKTSPRGAEMRRVADALSVPYVALEAAYQGVEQEPLPLQESVRELVDSLNDLVAELRMTRAEQVVVVEQMAEALGRMATTPEVAAQQQEARRRAASLSREETRPRRLAHPSEER